jgi:hypothetical protein
MTAWWCVIGSLDKNVQPHGTNSISKFMGGAAVYHITAW